MATEELKAPGKIEEIGWQDNPFTGESHYFVRWQHTTEDSHYVFEHHEPHEDRAYFECARIVNAIWHAAHPKDGAL